MTEEFARHLSAMNLHFTKRARKFKTTNWIMIELGVTKIATGGGGGPKKKKPRPRGPLCFLKGWGQKNGNNEISIVIAR